MKCPRDRKTEMRKHDDYLDLCPHCGVEQFAVERCIRDIVKNKDNLWDYSLSREKFLLQFDEGFRNLGEAAWERKNRKQPLPTT